MLKKFKKFCSLIKKKQLNRKHTFTVRFARNGQYSDSDRICFDTFDEDNDDVNTSHINVIFGFKSIFEGTFSELCHKLQATNYEEIEEVNNDLWLFVDENGNEMMTNIRPVKTIDYVLRNTKEGSSTRSEWLSLLKNHETSTYYYTKVWYNDVDEEYDDFVHGWFELILRDTINLPKGFIKFLTGKELTCEDEAINYSNIIKLNRIADGLPK